MARREYVAALWLVNVILTGHSVRVESAAEAGSVGVSLRMPRATWVAGAFFIAAGIGIAVAGVAQSTPGAVLGGAALAVFGAAPMRIKVTTSDEGLVVNAGLRTRLVPWPEIETFRVASERWRTARRSWRCCDPVAFCSFRCPSAADSFVRSEPWATSNPFVSNFNESESSGRACARRHS